MILRGDDIELSLQSKGGDEIFEAINIIIGELF